MKTVITILLAITLTSGAAFGQTRVGGQGTVGASANGGRSGSPATAGSEHSGVHSRADRQGPRVGVGATGGQSTGIGNSRINSAISTQGRGHRGGPFR
jgi:hypothetical protein